MKTRLTALAIGALCATVGCQATGTGRADDEVTGAVSYLTLDQLATAMAKRDEVTLVEFCVPTGCVRCDQMRGPIDGLAGSQREGIAIHRVDLRKHPQLAWEFRLAGCPSYVAFRQGEEVFRASHPTSADLILSGLEEALLTGSPAQLSLAAQ